jgi:hypothetical protein
VTLAVRRVAFFTGTTLGSPVAEVASFASSHETEPSPENWRSVATSTSSRLAAADESRVDGSTPSAACDVHPVSSTAAAASTAGNSTAVRSRWRMLSPPAK